MMENFDGFYCQILWWTCISSRWYWRNIENRFFLVRSCGGWIDIHVYAISACHHSKGSISITIIFVAMCSWYNLMRWSFVYDLTRSLVSATNKTDHHNIYLKYCILIFYLLIDLQNITQKIKDRCKRCQLYIMHCFWVSSFNWGTSIFPGYNFCSLALII
jgi:hypothetical protein